MESSSMTPVKILQMGVRFSLILINIVLSCSVFVVFHLTLRPILAYRPKLFRKVEGVMFRWVLSMVALWTESAGYTVYDNGEDVMHCLDDECLILVNHQSTADVPLLFTCFHNKGSVLNNMLWIMDIAFKWAPFGWVSQVHNDFFIQQGRDIRHVQIKRLFNHLRDYFVPLGRKWLVLFPEGGFLYKRREASQRFAEKNGHPQLTHVTLPRVGACLAVLQHLVQGRLEPSNGEAKSALPQQQSVNGIVNDKVKEDNVMLLLDGGDENGVVVFPNGVNGVVVGHGAISTENNKAKLKSASYLKRGNMRNMNNCGNVIEGECSVEAVELEPEASNTNNSVLTSSHQPQLPPTPRAPLKWVIDLTIGYAHNHPLDLLTIMLGNRPPCDTHIFYRIYPATDVPAHSEHALTEWLFQRWTEKEARLAHFYDTGDMAWLDADEYDSVSEEQRLHGPRRVTVSYEYIALIYTVHACLIYAFYWRLPQAVLSLVF